MEEPLVVVGGGLAAAKAVEAARETGYDGPVVLYGAEPHRPYERPPLSKAYLAGDAARESVFVHEEGWYERHRVELRLGAPVTGLDPAAHEITVGDRTARYGRLLLATGSTPRRLEMADRSGAPVAYLRTLEDSDRIRAALVAGARVAVVGGGWIGLEVTAAARAAGCEVTLVETLELPLLRVLGRELAAVFADLHREHGVDLRLGAKVTGVEAAGDAAVVRLGDGAAVSADLVVVGIGISPNTDLAERAGLRVDNGVVADERLRTSAPDVFAAGDVASAQHPVLGRRLRVEHWDNAIGQGTTAGRNLAGRDEAYDAMPYFFTDQYDLGMEYVGHVGPDGYDRVVLRGETSGDRVFTAFWLRGAVVQAAMHVNDWDAIEPIRGLVGHRVSVENLADPAVPLTEVG